MRRRFLPAALLLTAVAAALLSCSLEYDMTDEDQDSGRPEIELSSLRHTVIRSDRVQLRVHAVRSSTYQAENRQVLHDVYFWEYDNEAEIASEGRADRAEVMLDTEDITFSGEIQLYNHDEEAGIDADYLEWSNEYRRMQGRDGEAVVITRDDGSVIRGTGFLADMRERSIDFRQGVSGRFVDTAETAEEPDAEADNANQ